MTKRSPQAATTDDSSRSWASASSPFSSISRSSSTTRARISVVPMWSRTRARCASSRGLDDNSFRVTSSMWVGRRKSGLARVSPRWISLCSRPGRLIAALSPVWTASTSSPCCCIPRTRIWRHEGSISIISPSRKTARENRSGTDKTESFDHEGAIHRQPERP